MPTVNMDQAKEIMDLRLDLINYQRLWENKIPNGNKVTLLNPKQIKLVNSLPEKAKEVFEPLFECPIEQCFDTIGEVVKDISNIKLG